MEKRLRSLFPTVSFPDDSKKQEDNATKPTDPQKKEDQNKPVIPPKPTDPNDSRKNTSDLNHISFFGWLFISFLLLAILSTAGIIVYKVRQLAISRKPKPADADLNETIDLSYQPSQRASSFLNDTQPIK